MALPRHAHPRELWLRRLAYGYAWVIVGGLFAFTLTGSLALATGLTTAMAAHLVWGIVRTARWIGRRHDLWRALLALACGASAAGGLAVLSGLGWLRGLAAAYAWSSRFHYTVSPSIALYVLFCVLIAENTFTENIRAALGPGWWMKGRTSAYEHPFHLVSAFAASFALVLSGELSLEIPDAVVQPLRLVALALVAVQIALGVYGLWVLPSRHGAASAASSAGTPYASWMLALGWGWAAGIILAIFTNYCVALAAGAVQLVGR